MHIGATPNPNGNSGLGLWFGVQALAQPLGFSLKNPKHHIVLLLFYTNRDGCVSFIFGMKNQIVLLFYTNLSIRSHLEYAACGILIISNQLENWKKVQKHAAKLVLTVKKNCVMKKGYEN